MQAMQAFLKTASLAQSLSGKARRRSPARKTSRKSRQRPVAPTKDDIALCAYLIWETEGRHEGRHETHWSEAEAHLLARHAHDLWMSLPLCHR